MAKKGNWDDARDGATVTGKFAPSTTKRAVTARPAAGSAFLLVTQIESPFAPRTPDEIGLRGPGAKRLFIVPDGVTEALEIGVKISAFHNSRRVWWGNWRVDAVITPEGTAGEIPAGTPTGADDKDGNPVLRPTSYGVWSFGPESFAFPVTPAANETDGATDETKTDETKTDGATE